MLRLAGSLAVALLATIGFAPAVRAESAWLIPPVDGALVARFEPPPTRWGAGHRGVDYDVAPGTAVRAAARGVVEFAGSVGGSLAVTLRHEGRLQTTYSRLAELHVSAGDPVGQGTWIGLAGDAHDGGGGGLHFGVKLEGAYVDPEAYLGPLDTSSAISLAPVVWTPPDELSFLAPRSAGSHIRACLPVGRASQPLPPPNDNIAVAIAGLGSKTKGGVGADMYENGPELLGYEDHKVYRFSYAGSGGRDLHRAYARTDTYGDVTVAAGELARLLRRIGRRHPGVEVDLIAHSQGGIVARVFLQMLADAWDPTLPRVEHVLTFASPHTGAPLAGEIDDLDADTVTGGLVGDGLSAWSRNEAPVPDPRSIAVSQLAPGSPLMSWMAAEDVAFGTRVLALSIANDAIVPADRALWPGETSRVVPPAGVNGHAAILGSDVARGLAHAFLRDAPESCRGGWDAWGPVAGRAIGFAESQAAWLYGQGERALGRLLGGRLGAEAVEVAQRASLGRPLRSSLTGRR